MASEITGISTVYSKAYLSLQLKNYQSSTFLALCEGTAGGFHSQWVTNVEIFSMLWLLSAGAGSIPMIVQGCLPSCVLTVSCFQVFFGRLLWNWIKIHVNLRGKVQCRKTRVRASLLSYCIFFPSLLLVSLMRSRVCLHIYWCTIYCSANLLDNWVCQKWWPYYIQIYGNYVIVNT